MALATAQEIGRRIRERRHELGLTQAALAEKTGLSENRVCAVERAHTNWRLDTVTLICDALDLTLEVRPAGRFASLEYRREQT